MKESLAQFYPDKHLEVNSEEWLVAGFGTAKEVSDKLGISEGITGTALVFKMASYYGRASSDIWDWIKTQSEATDG